MTVDLNAAYQLPAAPTVAERLDAGELDADDVYNTYPAPTKPMEVARRLRGTAQNHPTRSTQHPMESTLEAAQNMSTADRLVALARETYQLGVDDTGTAFAYTHHRPHIAIPFTRGGNGFRSDLGRAYHQRHGKTPSTTALADAMTTLEGYAREQPKTPVHLRIAEAHETTYIDVGDTEGTVIAISGGEWTLQHAAPVKFRRSALTEPLPTPIRTGAANPAAAARIFNHLNVSAPDRRIVLGFITAALISAHTPHPVLALQAPHGTAKTTTATRITALIDPQSIGPQSAPRDETAWHTSANGSWVVALDNLSSIPDWLSDALCKAVTGDGIARRKLYTDSDLAVIRLRRCILFTGIDIGAMRGDLADRVAAVDLDPISEQQRRTETELAAEWARDYPHLFTGLLDFAAAVHHRWPTVDCSHAPRMADFAAILAAVDAVADDVGIPGPAGLDRFIQRLNTLAIESINANEFTATVKDLADLGRVDGLLASELLATAEDHIRNRALGWRRSKAWPNTAPKARAEIERCKPAFAKAGYTITTAYDRHSKTSRWTITPPPAELDGEQPPQPPQAPRTPAAVARTPQVNPTISGADDCGGTRPIDHRTPPQPPHTPASHAGVNPRTRPQPPHQPPHGENATTSTNDNKKPQRGGCGGSTPTNLYGTPSDPTTAAILSTLDHEHPLNLGALMRTARDYPGVNSAAIPDRVDQLLEEGAIEEPTPGKFILTRPAAVDPTGENRPPHHTGAPHYSP